MGFPTIKNFPGKTIFADYYIRRKSIAFKIAFFAWIMAILALVLYIVFSFPYQKEMMRERMRDEAADIARSVLHANSAALIAGQYQFVVDHCTNLVEGSGSIVYIVISKNDGYSLIFKKYGWYADSLAAPWPKSVKQTDVYSISKTPFSSDEVFQFTKVLNYGGIDWGYINVGLTLNSYNGAIGNITQRTILLTILLTVIGLLASFAFAGRFSRPIRELDKTTKKIADGNLEAKTNINTGDELQSLSESFNKMTASLKSVRDELESRVRERTAELARTNEVLLFEIQERLKAEESLNKYALRLKALEEIYRGLISAKSTKEIISGTVIHLKNLLPFNRAGVCIYDFEQGKVLVHSFIAVEGRFSDRTESFGVEEFETLDPGTAEELLLIDDLAGRKSLSAYQRQLINQGEKSLVRVALRYQQELVGEFNFASSTAFAFDEKHLGIIQEVSKQLAVAIVQVMLQEKLKIHAADLQNSLKEKVVLLKEIHHRVKNNLQIVSSLLYLQSRTIDDNETLAILKDGQSRIKSMALVHEKLYHSRDLALIEFADYIQNLTAYVFNNYREASSDVRVQYELDPVSLSIDSAVPLGLIINELLSNALKYAFNYAGGGKDGDKQIAIKLKEKSENNYVLSVADNGRGLPEDFDFANTESLGLKLVVNLVRQINGKFTVNKDGYTEFVVEFSDIN